METAKLAGCSACRVQSIDIEGSEHFLCWVCNLWPDFVYNIHNDRTKPRIVQDEQLWWRVRLIISYPITLFTSYCRFPARETFYWP